MIKCDKCGDKPRSQGFNAACDLRPMEGYTAPCALKQAQHTVDLDDFPENLITVLAAKPRQQSKKKGGRKKAA